MGKSSPQAPQAPDPVVTAKAQTDSNIATANNNAALNRVNQYTPWGSSTYTKNVGADGQPESWTQKVELSPVEQQLLDKQNASSLALGDTGVGMLGSVNNAMSRPLDYSGVTKINNDGLQYGANYGKIQDDNVIPTADLYASMKQAQEASYNQALSRLNPQWQQDQSDLENRLVQQGIMQNSDAWNRATESFGRNKNDAYQTASNNAVGEGLNAQSVLFGQGATNMQLHNAAQQQGYGQAFSNAQLNNQAAGQGFSQSMAQRQQGINELMAQRQNPLNELNALRTGSQVTSPTFGAIPQANQAGTDVAGITNNAYNNQLGLYNAQVGSNNATMGALGQLGGALGSAALRAGMFSDIRLKENIKRVGVMDNGIPIYTYNYIGDDMPMMGVMAQEVEQVIPDAVTMHENGFKQVHYGML